MGKYYGNVTVQSCISFFIPRLCACQCSRCDFAISHNTNHGLIFYFIAALVVALSLWRINRVHNPVALICEKKLLVAVPWSFINSDYHISFRAFYMPVEYNEVAGVSHNWSQLYIGARITGGLVALPVQLSYVSLGDKADFQNWVERKQEEVMENT